MVVICAPTGRLSTLRGALGRVLGVVAIAIGTVMIGFNPNRWDTVLFDIPFRQGHGVHLHDALGLGLVLGGTLLLWFMPRR